MSNRPKTIWLEHLIWKPTEQLVVTGTSRTMRRVFALQKARDKATNPDFKKLWEDKLKELIKLCEQGRNSYDTIH